MIRFPNAKINLGLSVTSKRADGYHNLETLFYPIELEDALEVVENGIDACRLFLTGVPVGGDQESNLVVKAYRRLQQRFHIAGVDIYLHKVIPSGAGMGGGSSDAAFMLKMLRELFSLPISDSELEAIAQELGADCPFFIRNEPVFAQGTGNLFSPVQLSLKGYAIVVIKPKVSVPTKDAFSQIVPMVPSLSIREVVKMDLANWRELLVNDFEKSVFDLYPEIAQVKADLYQLGAIYASMSGSGSAVFGLFRADQVVGADLLSQRFADCFIWQGFCKV